MTGFGARSGRIAGIGLIPILLATGFGLIYHHGDSFGGLSVSSYATTLNLKIIFALVSFGLVVAHGVVAMRASSAAVRGVGLVGATVSVLVVMLVA